LLKEFDHLPGGFLDARPEELKACLGGPALIHLPGRHERPLFVSVLLHGNEAVGLHTLQRLLEKYTGRELPRAVSLFVGNVEAAGVGLRRLAGQPDYNRVWPGTAEPDSPERRMMARIVEIMRQRRPFASVDLHNNTGINPHYACINVIDNRFMQLASLFSRTVVYFIRPLGVQSMAFAGLCPAVTVECGKTGQSAGVEHASEFIDACLHLSELPDRPPPAHEITLYHTVAIIKVASAYSFSFNDPEADVGFVGNLDHMNFRELAKGTRFGRLNNRLDEMPLQAWDEAGVDVANRYFAVEDDWIETRLPVMPSMLTLDERVIRQDCLGYLMERYPL
jgi:hypothetical protein